MDIFITGNLPKNENDTGQTVKLQLPALPAKIGYKSGARMMSFDIIDVGAVEIPNGNELTEYSWEAILPGEGRKHEPWIKGKWISPQTIENYFSIWKKNGVKLKLLVTGTPINAYVYLKEYEMNFEGGFGDYSYSVVFVSAVDISVSYTKVEKPKPSPPPQRPTPPPQRTYTVKTGDCLWNISRRFYGTGTQYMKIYNANKATIEEWQRKYRNREGPFTIYPGEVLVIP